MILESIEVHNVRNIQDEHFRLQPSLNLVLGPNGAGKTTFLECIHLLIRGRSFRPGQLNTLISFDAQELLVTASGRSNDGKLRLGISKPRNDNVRMRLNGADIRLISQIAARVPTQTFLPDLSALVFGTPSSRRSWLNWSVFHTNNRFIDLHRTFLRLLQQRNRALQQKSSDFGVWTEQFVNAAIEVTNVRKVHLQELNECFQQSLATIAPDLNIELVYDQGWTEDSLLDGLERDNEREQKYGHTRLGPHRADIRIRVRSNSGEMLGSAVGILSRGQGKVVACAMKLAQLEQLRKRQVYCVVLLDDIASELDDVYTRRFFKLLNLSDCQIVATTTKSNKLLEAGLTSKTSPNVIQLKAGKIVNN